MIDNLPLLGKRPKLEDARTLKLSKYLDTAALEPVPALDVRGAADVPMYMNDEWGDCGPAGVGHAVNAWRARKAKAAGSSAPKLLSQRVVTNFYVAVTKAQGAAFNPRTGANDTGVYLLTMLKVWRSRGIGGHKIAAFVEVDLTDELYDWASCAFGGLILGYNLPTKCQDMGPWTWTPPPRLSGEFAPGGWGGHCVYESANDQQGGTSDETWGAEKDVRRPFNNAYRDEAYAALSHDQLDASGRDVISGLALADLRSDLEKVAAKS